MSIKNSKDKKNNTRIGKIISDAREKKSLSQGMLAEISQVHQSAISAYERGAQEPGIAIMLRLAAALDIDLNELRDRFGEDIEAAQTSIHVIAPELPIYRLKLTTPQQIIEEGSQPQTSRKTLKRPDFVTSPQAYALLIDAKAAGPLFPLGTHVVVDPEAELGPLGLAVLGTPEQRLWIRQCQIDKRQIAINRAFAGKPAEIFSLKDFLFIHPIVWMG